VYYCSSVVTMVFLWLMQPNHPDHRAACAGQSGAMDFLASTMNQPWSNPIT
jgi:hypothetical protein